MNEQQFTVAGTFGEPTAPVEAAFNVVLTANRAFLPGVCFLVKISCAAINWQAFNN